MPPASVTKPSAALAGLFAAACREAFRCDDLPIQHQDHPLRARSFTPRAQLRQHAREMTSAQRLDHANSRRMQHMRGVYTRRANAETQEGASIHGTAPRSSFLRSWKGVMRRRYGRDRGACSRSSRLHAKQGQALRFRASCSKNELPLKSRLRRQ